MLISPLDIRKQGFRPQVFGGVDPDQVRSFLDQVAIQYETILKENNELATRVKHLEEEVEHYNKIEKALNDTMLSAQRTTDEARLNAQKEAELILKDAQIRAGRYEDESRRRVHDLESEIVSLKTQRDSFLARFRAMLKTQLELLNVISGDLKAGQGSGSKSADSMEDETMEEIPPQSNVASSMDL
jgi:cell division initiation protein